MNEPITRSEMYFAALGGEAVTPPEPITRMDMYLAYLNGMTDTYPDPITRTEQYLYKLCQNGMGGGGGVTIRNQNKTITENGRYKADSGYTGLGTVTVNVPQEEPVLQDKTVTENGTVTADAGFDGLGVVTVNVEASGGGDDLLAQRVMGTLKHYESEEVTELKNYALAFCTELESVSFPNLVTVDWSSLSNCENLKTVDCPKVTYPGTHMFYACKKLESVNMPLLTAIRGNMFNQCESMTLIDYPLVTKIEAWSLSGMKKLTTIVLRKSQLVTLAATNALHDTPFASGGTGGTVYVPAALISEYQAATNWSTLYAAGTCNFVAIEGSEYE